MKIALRWMLWLFGLVLLLAIALLIFIRSFDWNRAKPWISERVLATTQRVLLIEGDLSVTWQRQLLDDATRSWLPWPQINAKQLKLSNPAWSEVPQMVEVEELDFAISPISLPLRKVDVPAVRVSGAEVHLQREKDGRANWQFELSETKGSLWTFRLGDIVLDRGVLRVDDVIERVALTLQLEPLERSVRFADVLQQQEGENRDESAATIGETGARKFREAASESEKVHGLRERASLQDYEFSWTVAGKFRGSPIEGRGRSGAIIALHSDEQTFPLQARLRLGNTRIAFVGTLSNPSSLNALDMRLWLSGKSMSDLYPITGVTLPDTSPFATEGHLSGELKDGANVFRYEEFTGRVGASDIRGSLTYAETKPRAKLTGSVKSELIQFADLAPLIGAGSARRENDSPARTGKLFPSGDFRTDRWQAMDAEVDFSGNRVVHGEVLPVVDIKTKISLDAGKLQLKPLGFGFAGGRADGSIVLDGRLAPMPGEIELRLSRIKLKQLFPKLDALKTALGEINGSAALSSKGNSISELFAKSNGELKLLINDGAVSKKLLETAGLNIANIVITQIFGDKDVQIDCAASHFAVNNGVAEATIFVFDTTDALINITGRANLAKESLDFELRPHTKGLRIFSLRSPLYLRGSFVKPDVGVKKAALLARGGGALILGVFAAPAAALIPLIAPSHGEPNRCEPLLNQMRGKAKAP